jgi:hypothetical protein
LPVTILRKQRSRSIGNSGHLQRNTHVANKASGIATTTDTLSLSKATGLKLTRTQRGR